LPTMMLLLENGADVTTSFPSNKNILHLFAENITSSNVDELLDLYRQKRDITPLLQQLDHEGFTPLLRLVSKSVQYESCIPCNSSITPTERAALIFADWEKVSNRVMHVFEIMCTPETLNQTVDKIWEYRKPPADPLPGQPLPVEPTEPVKEEDKYTQYGGYNALHFLVCKETLISKRLMDALLARKINQSAQSIKFKRTPLYMAIDSKTTEFVRRLLKEPDAPIFIADTCGTTPLMRAVQLSIFPLTKEIINACPEKQRVTYINTQDQIGQSALLIACSQIRPPLDIIDILIKAKADPNLADKALRTPLFYAASIRNSDLASILVNAGANPKQTVSKNRTPLHIAVDASSSSDTSFNIEEVLLKAGADINACDALGRSPLHYAFVKMGNKFLDSSKIDPIEEVAALSSVDGIQMDIVDKFGRTPLHYASQRGATICALTLLASGANIQRADEDENTPLAISLLSNFPDYAIVLMQKGANPTVPLVEVKGEFNKENEYVKLQKTTHSIFRFVSGKDWQGVAYMLLDAGFPLFQAIHDVLRLGKCQHAYQLMRKLKVTKDDSIYAREQNQTLFHSLGQCPNPFKWESILLAQFKAKGIPLEALDKSGKNVLHYAVARGHDDLCLLLLRENIPHDIVDSTGFTPIVHAFHGDRIKNTTVFTVELLNKKCNLDIKFKEDPKKAHETTLLIRTIKAGAFTKPEQLSSVATLSSTADYLLKYGASIDGQDSRGRTPLMVAVCKNNMDAVQYLLSKKPKPKMNIQDKSGKTVVHYVVNPLEFGSWENVDMLRLLIQSGADPRIPDNDGKTPIYYAHLQGSRKMLREFNCLGIDEVHKNLSRTMTVLSFPPPVDFSSDAQKLIDEATAASAVNRTPQVDHVAKRIMGDVVRVHVTATGDVYDVLMMKVDIKQGKYGNNMFYKMQVLYNHVKNIYMLWNKWGRVGEVGSYQQTPYESAEAAMEEFEKIFAAKAKNAWKDRDRFVQSPGHYRMVALDYNVVSWREFMVPFDKKKSAYPPSSLTKPVRKLMKLLTDMAALKKAMKETGVNTDLLPLGTLKKSTLQEAQAVLLALKEKASAYKTIKNTLPLNLKTITETYQAIVDLSNKFYELVPCGEFKDCVMAPLEKINEISGKLERIHSLLNLEVAAKVLLGAQANMTVINPFDYCLRALNASIEPLDINSKESKLLCRYASKTHRVNCVKQIFRVRRQEEEEKFAPFMECENRLLLWHGSSISNFIGILQKGLCVAPIEAPSSGYRWGKGIYFADMLGKSICYCRDSRNSEGLVLLCEVAMGKMAEFYEDCFMLSPPEGFCSTKAMGRRGPDFNQSVILPCGVAVPCAKIQIYTAPPQKNFLTEYNEYIVYDAARVRIRYIVQVKC